MRNKNLKKNYYKTVLLLCAGLFCFFLAFAFLLPPILSSFVLPEIAKKAGIDRFSCDVKKIGLFETDFGSIIIGDKKKWGILIDSIKINYSPSDIFRKNIKSIFINGIKVFCNYEKGNLSVPGLYPFKADTPEDIPGKNQESNELLPGGCGIRDIEVLNACVYVNIEGYDSIPLNIEISKASLSGNFINSASGNQHFIGEVKLAETTITDKSSDIKISGIQAQLPLNLPYEDSARSGNFLIQDIFFAGKNCGSITGSIKQRGLGVEFDGNHKSRLISDFIIKLTGKSEVNVSNEFLSHINFKANAFKLKSAIDLGKFIKEAVGFKLDGSIELNGDFFYDNSGIKSSLKARLSDADLENQESKIFIRGINADLYLLNLFELKSAPAQVVKFKSANIGGIDVNDGWLEYEMDSFDSLFIEKTSFEWCKGRVDIQGIKISEGVDDYNIVLYCDGLDLAAILEQFEAAEAEGTGTVNGSIPVRCNNGKISFNDGFLFSAPGSGGRIKIRNAENLTAGISQNSSQFVNIEIAREALQDYQYKSANLRVNTENEDLLLNLEFDGKPTNPLPFVYKKELGNFAKIEAGQKGSVFQGIKLNVNFRLPLEKVLQYKDVFKMLK